MLNTLLSLPEDPSVVEGKKRRIALEKELDEALDTGEVVHCAFSDHTYYESLAIDMSALRMFGGYVARKARRISTAKTCQICFNALQAPSEQELREDDDIIHGRSMGHLIIPSDGLMNILEKLEQSILQVFQISHLHADLIFEGAFLKCI